MNQARPYPAISVTERAEHSIRRGHPWVYDSELTALPQDLSDGALADVLSPKGRYLGTGFYNSHSKIRVRILSTNANDKFDQAFFERRLRYALAYRKTVMGPKDYSCCRLVFGESDGLPGLTVDRFHNILVTQTLCLGMEQRKGILFPLLYRLLTQEGEQIDGIYERKTSANPSLRNHS